MLDTSKIPTKRVDGYYTHITNCITKIPQDIKLELVDGTLTLKAGSKVYVPNGVGVFDEVVVESDVQLLASLTSTYVNGDYSWCYNPTLNKIQGGNNLLNQIQSVTYDGTEYCMFYDTTNNIIKYTTNSGSTWEEGYSLPFVITQLQNGTGITSIDQVFNGFGYIGNTIFVLPGVEGIIPNGFNEDSSIKNIHCQIEEVQTKQTLNGWNNHWYVHLMGENLIEYHPWELYYNQVDKPMSVGQTAYWYNPNKKIVQSTDDYGTTWNTTRQVTPFLEVFQNGETITSIKPINVYENITSKTVENKFKVVSELPSFPEVGVFYFVKE